MADSKDSSTSGGIAETISSGVEYLQNTVTGATSSKETTGSSTTNSTNASAGESSSQSQGASASDIKDEHVSEFIRDKYKSHPEDWPETSDKQ